MMSGEGGGGVPEHATPHSTRAPEVLPTGAEPEPGDLTRTISKPHPQPEPEGAPVDDDSHPFRSCLDRPFVQKEIRWARERGRKIVVVFEKDERRAGFFDFAQAWDKYQGTEWESILNIDAEPYQRDEMYAEGMVRKILQKAAGEPEPAPAAAPKNEPGVWDCFLSHAQAMGGDQTQTTQLRLQKAGKTVWYDNGMLDRSTAAMEEGVRHSRIFVLFLTGESSPTSQPPAPALATPETGLAELCRGSSMAAGKVVERKQDFSDRRQLRQDLSDWALAAESREPGCLLLGGPGAGKTTLLTELVEDESSDFHAAVLATHFCVAHDAESLKPMSFVSGVAMQLYKGCQPYLEYVDATKSVQGKVKKLLSGGSDGEPLSSFVDLVLAPLKKACPGSERPAEGGFVLCIDSLDEALLVPDAAKGQVGSIVQLLKICSSKRLFPPWLKVLATSRDVPEVAQLKSWRRVDLGAQARLEENREAIRAYINIRLDAPDSPLRARVDEMTEPEPGPEVAKPEPECADEMQAEPGQFHINALARPYFAALVEQSGGNFLYAATALNDVEEGMGDLADVGSLPSGLDELFLHFFDRLFESADSEKYRRVRPVFEAIAASEGGVTEAALLACLRVGEPAAEERVLKAALQGVRQFLKAATATGSQDVLVFYHLSFGEWLQQEHDYIISVGCGHRALAVVLFAAMAEPLTDSLSDAFAAACVAQLECDESLQGRHIRKMRPRTPSLPSGEAVLELSSHLAQALDSSCGKSAVFAELFAGAIDLEAQAEPTDSDLTLPLEDFMERCGVENYHRYIVAGSAIRTARNLRQATSAELTAAMPSSWGKGATEQADHIAKMVQPTRGQLAAQLASAGGTAVCLRLLLDLGVDTGVTDKLGRTLVHLAAQHGRVDELCLLAESVDGVDSADVHAKTPLMWAAEKGQVEALRILLSKGVGAELEAKDKYGLTALHWAATNGQLGALWLLLSEGVGAELEAKDKYWRTPLHLAAANGQVEALALLLSKEVGAEREAKTKNGRTALHCAAQTGQVEALRLLLSEGVGAELEAKKKDGKTALHLAAMAGHVETIETLVELGASLDPDGDCGDQLIRDAGGLCDGDDSVGKTAVTVATLERLGVGRLTPCTHAGCGAATAPNDTERAELEERLRTTELLEPEPEQAVLDAAARAIQQAELSSAQDQPALPQRTRWCMCLSTGPPPALLSTNELDATISDGGGGTE